MKNKYYKYLEGNASLNEQKDILSYIKSSDENLKDFQNQKEEWKNGEDKLISLSTWKAWTRIEGEINPKIQVHKKWLYTAASVLVFIIASSIFYITNKPLQSIVAIQTKSGQLTTVLLPDSTEVDINSSTKIEYSTSWFGLTREVKLNGEAFFNVNSKTLSDFNVICNGVKVNVTGTRFNVKAYENEDVTVVLEEGSVNLMLTDNKNAQYFMKPGDMVVYNGINNKVERSRVETENYTSWKKGIIYFENNKLPDLLNSLERRYGVVFEEISDPLLENFTLTFTIRNEPIETIMNVISTALPVNITTNQETIKIQLDEEKYERLSN